MKACQIEGCSKPVSAKRFCETHYSAARLRGEVGSGRACSLDGCSGPVAARGMCHKHYSAAKARGELPGQTLCSVEGCGLGIAGQGLCGRHYYEARKKKSVPVATCSVEGCDRAIKGRGLCYTHLYKARLTGSVEANHCEVEGCDRPTAAYGLCRSHYKSAKYRGQIDGRKCSTSGCDRNTTARGLCQSHYSQAVAADAFPDMARCQWEGCQRRAKTQGYCAPHFSKAPSPELRCQFYGCERKFVDDGYCRTHRRVVLSLERRTREAAVKKEERARKRELRIKERKRKIAIYLRRYRYGLTDEQFEQLLAAQDRECFICHISHDAEKKDHERTKGLVVDHDHATGGVRGLLCHRCNRALGGLRDEVKLVSSAISYLTEPPAAGLIQIVAPESPPGQEDDVPGRRLINRSLASSGQKQCRECRQVLPISAFYKTGRNYSADCRVCRKALSPERKKLSKYGLSLDAYRELSKAQGDVCAICETVGRGRHKVDPRMPLVVDHDHETGAIRGLLCFGCNAAIGLLADERERLNRALAYLAEPPARAVLSATKSDDQPR